MTFQNLHDAWNRLAGPDDMLAFELCFDSFIEQFQPGEIIEISQFIESVRRRSAAREPSRETDVRVVEQGR